ncbi:MAG: hypothetical protein H8E28_13120 [Anaerolineae bacterium]|nr:hypothetical protein [Anaerolineae bacterium]
MQADGTSVEKFSSPRRKLTRPHHLVNILTKKQILFLILWSLLFTLAYSQAPLFTSNQNQYFLHGLAKAGWGDLSADWLANTLDPTPVFSGLVYITYRLLAWPPVFYLYFGILAGIYLFSLLGIVQQIFDTGQTRLSRGLFLALFTAFNAAALRFVLVRSLGTNWAYLFDGGVAGQRLLGEVFQPSTFGVLLLLAINLFLRDKPLWSALPLVLAATFHPTYLLSAGVLTAVFMGILLWEQRNIRQPLWLGLLALLGVLPILYHALIIFSPSGPTLIAEARRLLVEFRIPHHALPAEWWDMSVAVKIGLMLIAIYLTRKTRLVYILLVPFLVASLLTAAQMITGNHVLALLFPWRISTVLMPLALAALVGAALQWFCHRFTTFIERHERALLNISITAAILLALAGAGIFIVNAQDRATSPDHKMIAHVIETHTPGQVYVIPLNLQNFRLETGASIFVEFKSIPYKDEEVLEWYRRVRMAGRLYQAINSTYGCAALEELYAEGVTHVVLPYDHTAKNCPTLQRDHLDINYEVFTLIPPQ